MHEPVFKKETKKNVGFEIRQRKVLVWGHRRLGNSRICVHPSIFSSFWLKSSPGSTLQMFGGGKKLPRCLNSLHNTHADERRAAALLTPELVSGKRPLSKKPHCASLLQRWCCHLLSLFTPSHILSVLFCSPCIDSARRSLLLLF